MSTIPGNPHYDYLQPVVDNIHEWQSSEGDTDATRMAQIIEANLEATLAVAYEQRTANLIARLALNVQAATAGIHLNESALTVDGLINQRLGLKETP